MSLNNEDIGEIPTESRDKPKIQQALKEERSKRTRNARSRRFFEKWRKHGEGLVENSKFSRQQKRCAHAYPILGNRNQQLLQAYGSIVAEMYYNYI